MADETVIELGTITCPSGRLVIVDTGYLGLWSGGEPPVAQEAMLAGIEDAELRESIRASADLAIVGPDAERAARSFDRRPGRWLYDIPRHAVEQITRMFDEHCRERELDARLEPVRPKVAHRERAERCGRGGAFLMHGVPVVAAGGLPADREIPVVGVRRDFGALGELWESVSVEVGSGDVVSSSPLGEVGVDAARLSLADSDGLSAWLHDDPIDGLADVAFWGRTAREAAARFDVPPLGKAGEDGVYGWANLPAGKAVERVMALEDWTAAAPLRRLMVDFRPHSHHWQIMALVRASEHETGAIEVGGTRTLCFMTGWGDGLYPVHADHDADGALVRIRIVLGDPDRRERLEDLNGHR